MFDLFRSRQKAVRYILGALLMVVALSMVITLIPGYGSSSRNSSDDSILADIGDQKLTTQETQRTIQQLISSGRIAPTLMEVYAPQLIEQMVQERALVYEFERLGLTASDDEVLTGLIATYNQFFQNGVLASRDQFEGFLAQQGMTLQGAIELTRLQLIMRKVENTLFAATVVAPQDVEKELIRKYEKAKIDYIAFPPAKFRGEVNPSTEEVRAYFEARRAQYPIPEKRSFQALVVDQDKVEATLTISDAQLRAAYSANMDNFRMPERVHVRHILVKTTDKSDAEKKQLLAKAKDVLKQLKNGADFGELAKKYSDDPGSGQKGGDLEWVVRGQMVAEFEKAAFSLKPKELSDIVTTTYGYHIVQALEKESARVKPFEEVRAGIAADLKKEGVTEKMQSTGDQVRAALAKSPGTAAEIAKQFGVDLVTVPKAAASDAIPTLGASPEIDNALSTMKKNDVSPVLVLPSNRLAVVVLHDRFPQQMAEFSEVESKVREQFITEKAQRIGADRATEAAAKLNAGADMAKLAKSLKLDVTESTLFGRSDSVEGLGSAVYVEDAFLKPVGTIVGPVMIEGRNVVYKVTDKKSADPAQLAAERKALTAQLKQKAAASGRQLLLDSVLTKLEAEGKVKIHGDVVKRLSASYRQ